MLLTGCNRNDAQSYRAPKDQPITAPPAASAGMGGGMMGAGAGPIAPSGTPAIAWELPAGWQELPAGQMRVGYFQVSGASGEKAQVTIIPLPGMAGGDFENVNRWRGQVGLGALTQDEFATAAKTVTVGGLEGALFEMAGKPADQTNQMRMAAVILHREGTAWFFKMLGDDALVTAQKPVFTEFLKKISFDKGMASHPAMATDAGTTPTAPSLPPPADTGGRPTWTVPSGWQEQTPGQMQMAKYTASGDAGAKADITVVVLPGDAGGQVANVNRWRTQIGLAPLDEAAVSKLAQTLEAGGA